MFLLGFIPRDIIPQMPPNLEAVHPPMNLQPLRRAAPLLLLLGCIVSPVFSGENLLAPTALPAASQVQQIAPNRYQIGSIIIDAASRELQFPGRINMNQGLIEVIVCTAIGKLHESIVSTTIDPLNLHTALLLLGLKAGSNPGWHFPKNYPFKPKGWDQPPGGRIDVFICWQEKDGLHQVRVERFLKDNRTGTPLQDTHWVFTGSQFDPQGNYLAREVGSLITNYHDFTSVIDLPLEAGQDDFMLADQDTLPAVGTEVQVRIVAVGEKK